MRYLGFLGWVRDHFGHRTRHLPSVLPEVLRVREHGQIVRREIDHFLQFVSQFSIAQSSPTVSYLVYLSFQREAALVRVVRVAGKVRVVAKGAQREGENC